MRLSWNEIRTRAAAFAKQRRLLAYETPTGDAQESHVAALSPYLIDAGHLADIHLVVKRQRTAVSNFPKISVGTKPVDGGQYLFGETERAAFLAQEPNVASLLRPFLGGAECINGRRRWLLHVSGHSPKLLRALPSVMKRVQAVRQYRANKAGRLGQSLAGNGNTFPGLYDAPGRYWFVGVSVGFS